MLIILETSVVPVTQSPCGFKNVESTCVCICQTLNTKTQEIINSDGMRLVNSTSSFCVVWVNIS